MIKDFIVNITKQTKPVEKIPFGTILIADTGATKEYTEYANIESLAIDFPLGSDVYKIADTIFGQDFKPSKVAVFGVKGATSTTPEELVAGLVEIATKPFFGLVCVDNTDPFITALGNWVDGKEKIYAVTSQSKTASALVESDNVLVGYHETPDNFLAEGLLSYMLTNVIGGVTAKFKKINKVAVSKVSDTDLLAIHDKNGFSYVEKYGNAQTSEGKVTSGEYLDIILGYYYIKLEMERDAAQLAYNNPKISYDAKGISLMSGVVKNVLSRATTNGIVAINADGIPQYNIITVPRENTSTVDISNREYNGISWTVKVAGAIHGGTISGLLTI